MNRVALLTLSLILLFLLLPVKAYLAEPEQDNLPVEIIQEQPVADTQPPQEQEPAQAAVVAGENMALVTMDFEDADMRDVIRVIAMASGMNIVIGEDVQAKVTISLKDVQWEKALDIILRTYNFTYKKEGNLIRIMTFEKVKQEERDIPLVTKIIYLNFADVSNLQSTLAKMLSDRGTIEIDARTNSMLISDIPAKVEEVEFIAKKLDTRTPQVLIEAMLVDVKLTKYDDLGINWKIMQVAVPLDQSGKGDENYAEAPADPMTATGGPSLNVGFLKRFGPLGIDGLVRAWIQDDKANVLASPKIVTLDNQTAKIEIKDQVAYTQLTQNDSGGTTTSTQFKDVITGLEVTPHITKEGFVSMNVKPRQEYVDGTVGGEPKIASRSAETNVLIEDGETIAIGGLRKVKESVTIIKVPFLGDIPGLGKFFRKKDTEKENTELLMFVTPRIIVRPILTDEEIGIFNLLDETRGDFLKDWQKEKRRGAKSSKAAQQALLISPIINAEVQQTLIDEELALSELDLEEDEDFVTLPKININKKQIQQELPQAEEPLEDSKDYIYSW